MDDLGKNSITSTTNSRWEESQDSLDNPLNVEVLELSTELQTDSKTNGQIEPEIMANNKVDLEIAGSSEEIKTKLVQKTKQEIYQTISEKSKVIEKSLIEQMKLYDNLTVKIQEKQTQILALKSRIQNSKITTETQSSLFTQVNEAKELKQIKKENKKLQDELSKIQENFTKNTITRNKLIENAKKIKDYEEQLLKQLSRQLADEKDNEKYFMAVQNFSIEGSPGTIAKLQEEYENLLKKNEELTTQIKDIQSELEESKDFFDIPPSSIQQDYQQYIDNGNSRKEIMEESKPRVDSHLHIMENTKQKYYMNYAQIKSQVSEDEVHSKIALQDTERVLGDTIKSDTLRKKLQERVRTYQDNIKTYTIKIAENLHSDGTPKKYSKKKKSWLVQSVKYGCCILAASALTYGIMKFVAYHKTTN